MKTYNKFVNELNFFNKKLKKDDNYALNILEYFKKSLISVNKEDINSPYYVIDDTYTFIYYGVQITFTVINNKVINILKNSNILEVSDEIKQKFLRYIPENYPRKYPRKYPRNKTTEDDFPYSVPITTI